MQTTVSTGVWGFQRIVIKKTASPGKKSATKRRPPPSTPDAPPRRIGLRSEALHQSIGYSLRRAQYSTYDEFTSTMESFDVRPSQFAVLVLINANPGLTQSAICSALGIQKTNFVALLDKLESRGLTERRKVGGDRRSSALHLTQQGQSFVDSMEAAHASMEARIAQRLGVKRTRDLLAALHEFTVTAPSKRL